MALGTLTLTMPQLVLADNNDDIIQVLVSKGILTKGEGEQLLLGREKEREKAQKQVAEQKASIDSLSTNANNNSGNNSKLVLADYINSITPTGDIRVRYETRKADGYVAGKPSAAGYEKLDRARYAWHFGLKTTSDNDFFSEIRFASNNSPRSPNVDFSSDPKGNGGPLYKDGGVYVDRLYIGWKTTDWLTLLAGRMVNPLYTTPLVWDTDLTPEGLAENFQTKVGNNTTIFGTLGQFYVKSKYQRLDNGITATESKQTIKMFPIQVGLRYQMNDDSSIKVAPVVYNYAGEAKGELGLFTPGNSFGNATAAYGTPYMGVNHLQVIELPAEYNWAMNGYAWKLFGDYGYNTKADDRAKAAATVGCTACGSKGSQDSAVMIGLQVGSKISLNKWESIGTYVGSTAGLKKHDWVGRLWYQRIEAFALDPNLIDSDVMNAQVNLKGFAASASFMLSDNAYVSLSAAHATRIDNSLGTGASIDTSTINATKTYDLMQADVVWKF
jgi:hypothetical protein